MFQKILVPVDLADPEFVKPALDTAVELAQASGGSVRLINVIPMTPVMLAEYVPPDFDVQQRGSAEEALAIIAKESGLPADKVSTVVRQGGIYHEVLEEAKAFGADIIVMSSHRPAMKTYFLGSNAGHMVRYAKCSVLVVRKPASTHRGGSTVLRAAPRPDGTCPAGCDGRSCRPARGKTPRNAAMNAAPLQACDLQRAHDQPRERERRADEHRHAEPVDQRPAIRPERSSARRPRRCGGTAR